MEEKSLFAKMREELLILQMRFLPHTKLDDN